MKRTIEIRLLKHYPQLVTRVLPALVGAALLALTAPGSVRADDGVPATKHARHHLSAKLRHTRHVHYVSDPQHEVPREAPVQVIGHKTDEAPLDPTLYRSWQENNLINPG